MELERGHPLVILDGGDSLGKEVRGKTEAGLGQRRAKARLIAEEWVASGLDAAALGEMDWNLGTPFVLETTKRAGYPVVAANLVCEGGKRPFPAARVFEHGDRKVGVVGVTAGEVDGCAVTDPAEAAVAARALLPEDVDVTVLLWPDRFEKANFGAREGLDFDFLLDASGRAGKDLPQRAGSTWMLGGGMKTKSVSIVTVELGDGKGYFPDGYRESLEDDRKRLQRRIDDAREVLAKGKGKKEMLERQIAGQTVQVEEVEQQLQAFLQGGHNRMEVRSITLDEDIPNHAPTFERVEAVKATFSELDDATGAEVISRPMRIEHGPYVGTEGCISCHPTQYNQWRSTGHARAISVLVAVDRHRDEDCFSCHVTGAAPAGIAGYPVTIADSTSVGGGNNVQCEACHGPGRDHAADPTKHHPVKTPPETLCRACHTPEQDEGRFDFAQYLPKVAHPDPAE
ncbi:MAG: multiheme c-type cytochrome [Myxococcota bacterium]